VAVGSGAPNCARTLRTRSASSSIDLLTTRVPQVYTLAVERILVLALGRVPEVDAHPGEVLGLTFSRSASPIALHSPTGVTPRPCRSPRTVRDGHAISSFLCPRRSPRSHRIVERVYEQVFGQVCRRVGGQSPRPGRRGDRASPGSAARCAGGGRQEAAEHLHRAHTRARSRAAQPGWAARPEHAGQATAAAAARHDFPGPIRLDRRSSTMPPPPVTAPAQPQPSARPDVPGPVHNRASRLRDRQRRVIPRDPRRAAG
jgi:hypothetical protein